MEPVLQMLAFLLGACKGQKHFPILLLTHPQLQCPPPYLLRPAGLDYVQNVPLFLEDADVGCRGSGDRSSHDRIKTEDTFFDEIKMSG